jgi:hypothetical protein
MLQSRCEPVTVAAYGPTAETELRSAICKYLQIGINRLWQQFEKYSVFCS